jgi:mannosyl-oligosaccharide alpha-1,2-mannosidase
VGYEEPPSEASDRPVLNSSAFPAQVAYMSASMAMAIQANSASPRPADPHLGEIPEHLLAVLSAPRTFTPPPRPTDQGWTSIKRVEPKWLKWRDGSDTTREDAMHPERVALEDDWRKAPYSGWQPPLKELREFLDGKAAPLPKVQHAFEAPQRHSGKMGDEQREALIKERQILVKNAFLHAWDGYKALAWGHDELKPVSQEPHDNFNVSEKARGHDDGGGAQTCYLQGWGATIVDALDTLLVMDLREDYDVARQHVRDIDFTFLGGTRSAYGTSDGRVPVFETVIRYLGGLLSAHDLAGDELMLERAEELAQLILPAFETFSGLPQGRLRLGAPPLRSQAGAVVLAEAGSHLLEFTRLWQLTGNRTYFDKVQRTTDWLDRNTSRSDERLGTLLPTTLFPESRHMFGAQR